MSASYGIPRNGTANISSRGELNKGIELLAVPKSDNMIEGAAKAFGQRHVSAARVRSHVTDLLVGW